MTAWELVGKMFASRCIISTYLCCRWHCDTIGTIGRIKYDSVTAMKAMRMKRSSVCCSTHKSTAVVRTCRLLGLASRSRTFRLLGLAASRLIAGLLWVTNVRRSTAEQAQEDGRPLHRAHPATRTLQTGIQSCNDTNENGSTFCELFLYHSKVVCKRVLQEQAGH